MPNIAHKEGNDSRYPSDVGHMGIFLFEKEVKTPGLCKHTYMKNANIHAWNEHSTTIYVYRNQMLEIKN